jgi:hypothetical protein
MQARRAAGREVVIFSTGLHWITLAPALLCMGIAGAVENWGTSGLVERLGLEALPEQMMATLGFDLDSLIATLAVLVAVVGLGRGLVHALSTHLRVTSSGVHWEQRGFRAHEVSAGFEVIDGVRVEQGLLGRILGYGTVNVLGRNAIGRRRRMSRPEAFAGPSTTKCRRGSAAISAPASDGTGSQPAADSDPV